MAMKMELITETGRKNVSLCYQKSVVGEFSALLYSEDDIVYRLAQALTPQDGFVGYVYVTPDYDAVQFVERYRLGVFTQRFVNIKGIHCPVYQFDPNALKYYTNE